MAPLFLYKDAVWPQSALLTKLSPMCTQFREHGFERETPTTKTPGALLLVLVLSSIVELVFNNQANDAAENDNEGLNYYEIL